jgi:hypothetical protein
VLHSCRCVVFGCLDSNPGLNSHLFACFRKETEIGKRKEEANLPTRLSPQPATASFPARLRRGPFPFKSFCRPHFPLASARPPLRLGPASFAGPVTHLRIAVPAAFQPIAPVRPVAAHRSPVARPASSPRARPLPAADGWGPPVILLLAPSLAPDSDSGPCLSPAATRLGARAREPATLHLAI